MANRRMLGVCLAAMFLLFAGRTGEIAACPPGEQASDKQIVLHLKLYHQHPRLEKVQLLNAPYYEPRAGSSGDLRIELISHHNRPLYEKRFSSTTTMFWDTFDPETGLVAGSGSKEMPLNEFVLQLPYFNDAQRIKIFKQKILPNNRVIEILIGVIQLPPRSRWEVIP